MRVGLPEMLRLTALAGVAAWGAGFFFLFSFFKLAKSWWKWIGVEGTP